MQTNFVDKFIQNDYLFLNAIHLCTSLTVFDVNKYH